jgi:nitrite reductase/ring-hydroxylating ferredoxin subunit
VSGSAHDAGRAVGHHLDILAGGVVFIDARRYDDNAHALTAICGHLDREFQPKGLLPCGYVWRCPSQSPSPCCYRLG